MPHSNPMLCIQGHSLQLTESVARVTTDFKCEHCQYIFVTIGPHSDEHYNHIIYRCVLISLFTDFCYSSTAVGVGLSIMFLYAAQFVCILELLVSICWAFYARILEHETFSILQGVLL